MKAIAILPEGDDAHPKAFRAVAGARKAAGRTPGEALDALTSQPGAEKTGAAVVVQLFQPDSHFTAEQSERLSTLMARWRIARDLGSDLPPAEQEELKRLVEQELQGSAERSARMSHEFETARRRRDYEEKKAELRLSFEKERRRASRLYRTGLAVSVFGVLLMTGVGILFLSGTLPSGSSGQIIVVAGVALIFLSRWWLDAAYRRLAERRRFVEESLRFIEIEALFDLLEDRIDRSNQRERTGIR